MSLVVAPVADEVLQLASTQPYTAFENTKCVAVSFDSSTGTGAFDAPLVQITSLPAKGALYHYDASKPFGIGAPVAVGDVRPATDRVCFQPVQHEHSDPESMVYASFTVRLRTDYDITVDGSGALTSYVLDPTHANAAETSAIYNIDVYITPVFFPPF